MGSSMQTSNEAQHSVTQPWAPAIPGLQSVIDDGTALYRSGSGTGIYAGQRVAALGDDTLNGLQSIRDQFASDNTAAQGISFAQGLLGSGGISGTTRQGLDMLAAVPNVDVSRLSALANRIGSASNPINQTASAFMSGSRDLTTIPQLDQLYARSQAPSAAETNLSSVARGDFLDPTTNPYVQKLAAVAADNASLATKGAFAASGRYGSGAFSGANTKAINDTQTALYADQYNKERANQFSANSLIDSARQTASQLGLGITNAKSGVESTNNSQRLAGAQLGQSQQTQEASVLGQVLGGDEFNSSLGVQKANGFIGAGQTGQAQALQATGMLPALDSARYQPAKELLGAGSLLQAQDQANIGSAMDLFDENNQMPWNALNRYAGLMGGIGGMGGETNSTGTRSQSTNPGALNSILGAATGIGGTAANLGRSGAFGSGGWLSSLFGSGASGAAAGAAGEAAAGFSLDALLPAAFMLSDERAKENIEEVGVLHDGQPIYRYNYKGDPTPQIGLLAQEVAARDPGAVGEMPGMGGLLGVDYGRATERAATIGRGA